MGLGGHEPDFARGWAGSNALPVVRVDPKRPSRVYVAWSANYGLWNLESELPADTDARKAFRRRPYLAVSDDGGRTFSRPVDMAGDRKESVTQPALAIGSDGEVFALFGETQVTEFGET